MASKKTTTPPADGGTTPTTTATGSVKDQGGALAVMAAAGDHAARVALGQATPAIDLSGPGRYQTGRTEGGFTVGEVATEDVYVNTTTGKVVTKPTTPGKEPFRATHLIRKGQPVTAAALDGLAAANAR